jgi:hypothetical protein
MRDGRRWRDIILKFPPHPLTTSRERSEEEKKCFQNQPPDPLHCPSLLLRIDRMFSFILHLFHHGR